MLPSDVDERPPSIGCPNENVVSSLMAGHHLDGSTKQRMPCCGLLADLTGKVPSDVLLLDAATTKIPPGICQHRFPIDRHPRMMPDLADER